MNRPWESVFLAGILFLGFILAMLMYRPVPGPRDEYIRIDTELREEGPGVSIAKLKTNLNEQQHLDNLSYEIGEYRGQDSGNAESLANYLKAETLLMRAYWNPNDWGPRIFLTIVSSSSISSIHPVRVCYKAAGYSIIEDSVDTLYVSDSSLKKRIAGESDGSLAESISDTFGINSKPVEIPIVRLLVEKPLNDATTERRLVFFVILKDLELYNKGYSLIRVSTILPETGEYADQEQTAKQFMGDTLSYIFEDISENQTRLIDVMAARGTAGRALIGIILAIPAFMILYPLLSRKLFSKR